MSNIHGNSDLSDIVGEYEHLQEGIQRNETLPGFEENLLYPTSLKSQQHFLVRSFSAMEKGSIRGSIFMLSSTALGAGILSIPWVFRSGGMGLGILMILLGSGLAVFTMQLLIASADKVGITQYSELVRQILGDRQALTLQLVIILYSFGACTGYLIVVGDAFNSILRGLEITQYPFNDEPRVLVMVTVLLAFPLALVRELGGLKYASIVAVLSIVYLVIAVVIDSAHCQERNDFDPPHCYKDNWTVDRLRELTLFKFDWDFFSAFTIVLFAYASHTNLFSVYDELHNRGIRRMKKVSWRSVIVELLLYLVFGIAGYLTFGDFTEDNILNNYRDTNWIMMAGRIAMCLSLIISVPLNVNPARDNYERIFHKNQPFSMIRHVCLTIVLVGLSLLFAIYIPQVKDVFSVLGATCCVYFCFILPIWIYLTVFDQYISDGIRYVLIFILCSTVVIGIISCVETIMQFV